MALEVYSVCGWDMQLVDDRQLAHHNHELVVSFEEFQSMRNLLAEAAPWISGNVYQGDLRKRILAKLEESK